MSEFELWVVVWIGLVVIVTGGWLLVDALSRPSREWIRRMQSIERGRARQRAEWIKNGCFYGRDHE